MIPSKYRKDIETQLSSMISKQNEIMLKTYDEMYDRLPSNLTEEQRIQMLQDSILSITKSLTSSIDLVKKELKEQIHE